MVLLCALPPDTALAEAGGTCAAACENKTKVPPPPPSSCLSWAMACLLQEHLNKETGAVAQLWVKALRCQRDAPAACLARPKGPNARGKEDDGERSFKPGVEAHSTQQLSEADWGVPLRSIQQVARILWAAKGVYFLRPGVCFLTCAGRGCLG